MNTSNTPSQLSRHYVFFLIFVAMLGAFSSLVNDMYLPTVPAIMREFHTTPAVTQLGLALAMAGLGIGSAICGSASDHYGRKPVLYVSLAAFCAATAVCLFAHNITFFVICRFVQGLTAGGAVVLSRSIPTDISSGRELAKIMAIVGAINGIAPALGPTIGGCLADSVGWRGIFVVLLGIGLIMLAMTARSHESLSPDKRVPARSLRDYLKAYGVLFRNGRFMLYAMTKAAAIALLYAYISSAPFIIQDHFHFSSFHFGLIFGGNALFMALGSMLVLKFKVLKNGLIAGTAAMFLFAAAEALCLWLADSFVLYEVLAVLMLTGAGMNFAAANTLAMEEGHSDAGTASAILSVTKYALAGAVTPLVGLGNIFHSSAIAFAATAGVAFVFALFIRRLAPLADMIKK